MAKPTKKQENPLLSRNIPPLPEAKPDIPENSKEAQSGNTVIPHFTVKPQTGKREKITFYPDPNQANKLYDLMEAYRRRTGIRINQQDLLRRLLEVAQIDWLIPQ
jgi:hypothetical protein